MSNFRLLLILIIVSCFFGIDGFAQSKGKISGKVSEKDTNEPIPYANVIIEGTTLGAATDNDGNYVILNVPPGLHKVTASIIGFQKVTVQDVRVNVDFTTRLDFKLKTSAVDLPAVVIQGERNPLIRQDLTNPTVAITSESIQELPVDQISDVIKLQAGVVTGDDGSLHVRGGYGNEIAFTLNGVSVNDPYGNARSVGVATNAVQEVSVSTGTFNAQYGNALSGVVNYVTKEGSDKYSFGIKAYGGDYATDRKGLFQNIDKIDLLNRGRVEATFGGPVPGVSNLNFYFSGVYENFKGCVNGIKLYNTTDSYLTRNNFRTGDSRKGSSSDSYYFNPYSSSSNGGPTGDTSYVPMDPSTSWNIQGNVSLKITPTMKLKLESVYNKDKSKGYSMSFKYNPDGVGTSYGEGLINALDFTHTINNNMFYTLKVSYGYNIQKYYLYDNFDDPRYLPSLYLQTLGNTTFYTGGTDNYRSNRRTTTIGLKGDLVAQMFKTHEMKFGFELRKHKLSYENYSVEIGRLKADGSLGALTPEDLLYDTTLVLLRRIPTSASLYTNVVKEPTQFAAYVQDKIELASTLILNAGLRYEYFDPNTTYNPEISKNLTDSLSGYITAYNKAASAKHTLSPRISLSYPITDKGIIRLSYGHFYQTGSLSSLYSNSKFYVTNVGSTPTFGNANVEPQKAVQYEIGLQQQLTDDFKFDLTGFYKDVTNYIYTQTVYTDQGRAYNVLTNLAYTNVRGITLSFVKRRAPGELFSASLDYTFSIAEGNRTEPAEDLFYSDQSKKQTETYLVPLDFDRSHVINATVALTDPNNWTAGIVANFQTGTPYYPVLPSQLATVIYEQNSANQPVQWNVDFKFEKYFKFDDVNFSLFLQIENLFDTQNERSVYASSGRALSNVEQQLNSYLFDDLRSRISKNQLGMVPLSQLNDYYSQRPERVNRPREVRVGFSILFN